LIGKVIKYEIKTYSDIQKLLQIAINDFIAGKITSRKARALGYLYKFARDIQSDAELERKDKEVDEIVERNVAQMIKGWKRIDKLDKQ